MHPTAFFGVFALAVSASPFPGFVHDKPHHTHDVLINLHKTPHCAYRCIFDETYPIKFAPECMPFHEEPEMGKEFGACLCKANGYQYMLDQCVGTKCSKKERKEVKSTLGYG